MFKKCIHADRKNRIQSGSCGHTVGEETGCMSSSHNAGCGAVFSQFKLRGLCEHIVQRFKGKNNNEHSSSSHGTCGSLEYSDYEIGSVENEIYTISLKLSLCLNSGYVLKSALDWVLDDCEGRDSDLCKLLVHIRKRAEMKNTSFESELFLAAKALKKSSLLRLAALLYDNKNKGNDLADKLERDRMLSRNERLSSARAKAKKAETKLCFPLMLLLLSMITVCIAPALMSL